MNYIYAESNLPSRSIISLGLNRQTINDRCPFEAILGPYFSPRVTSVIIVDPYLKQDFQQHLVLLLFQFIKEKCRLSGAAKQDALKITLCSGATRIEEMDRTDFWPNTIPLYVSGIYKEIFNAVGFDKNVAFMFKSVNWHDRTICIYEDKDKNKTSMFTHIKMGKGLGFLNLPCNCQGTEKPLRGAKGVNNEYEYSQTHQRYFRNDRKQYAVNHYRNCVREKTSQQFLLQNVEFSVQQWDSEAEKISAAFYNYLLNADVNCFNELGQFEVQPIAK